MNSFYEITLPLYTAFVEKTKKVLIPSNFINIVKKVMNKIKWNTEIKSYNCKIKTKTIPENKKVMLALSSGLDSTYLLQKLISDGFEVTACYVKGLNKQSQQQEYLQAKKLQNCAK